MIATQNPAWLLLLSFLTLLHLLFTNCSPFDSVSHLNQASDGSSSMVRSIFYKNKVQIDLENSAYSSNQNRIQPLSIGDIVPQDLPLMMIANNGCLASLSSNERRQLLGPDVKIAVEAFSSDLPQQAYHIELKSPLSISQMRQVATRQHCVIGITNNSSVQVSGDPRLKDQEFHKTIKSTAAWDLIDPVQTRETVVVAVVDTGIDYTHEDLSSMMWRGEKGNYGINFTSDNANDVQDRSGHGTHVAGLIAAKAGNSYGGAGVSGVDTKIMAIKALSDDGKGNFLAIYNGVVWAVNSGADVINMSLGGGFPGAHKEALLYAVNSDVVVVVAAGNSNQDLDTHPTYPALYGAQIPGVITVGSINEDDFSISSFSNYSPTGVEIFAPGSRENGAVGIISTAPENSYERMRGTSMAAPIVAGAAALAIRYLRQENLSPTAAAVERFITSSGSQKAALRTKGRNGRVLNLEFLAKNLAGTDTLTRGEDAANMDDPRSRFIKRLYGGILARIYDVEGVLYWKGQLEKDVSLYLMIKEIVHSNEYRSRHGAHEGEIRRHVVWDITTAVHEKVKFDLEEEYGDISDRLLGSKITINEAILEILSSSAFNARLEELGVAGSNIIEPRQSSREKDNVAAIQQAYKVYLGRQADQKGLNYWLEQMRSGISLSEIRSNLKSSPEASIRSFYLAHFHREPDERGVNYWLNENKNGKSFDQIRDSLRSSEECKADCLGSNSSSSSAANSVTSRSATSRISNSQIKSRISSYYKQHLGRTPDASGLIYWTNQVTSGQTSLARVEGSIRRSSEAVIRGYYLTYLRREPDTAGMRYYLNEHKKGKSLYQVRDSLRSSQECKSGCL